MQSNKTTNSTLSPKKAVYTATLDGVLAVGVPILSLIQEGVIVIDADETIRFVNDAAVAIGGCKKEDVLGKKLENCFGKEAVSRLRKRNYSVPRELSLRLGGKFVERVVKTMSSPIIRETELLGVVIVLRNEKMADRVNANEFKQTHNIVRAIDKLKDRVCLINDTKRGGSVFISESIKDVTGWSAKTFLNGSWAFLMTLFHPDDLATTAETMKATFAKYAVGSGFESEPYQSRYRFRHKDGHWLRIEENGCLLERDVNGFPRYLISFLDVMDSKATRKARSSSSLKLTQREFDVAHAVVMGESSKIIANRLGLSVHTVNEVRKHLLHKTGAANTASLVKFLSEHDIR